MKTTIIFLIASGLLFFGCNPHTGKETDRYSDSITTDTIQYHAVRIGPDGGILPWFSANAGQSYDTVLALVWHFWKNMESDSNGIKYYMNHQVWKPEHDMRGLGGDQINMALSSWGLYYAYTGDTALIGNMRYMADYYLSHSLSRPDDAWPNLPYPYNTDIHSGYYDGDMRNGKGVLQPDKAGSFGYELINLYKITGDSTYLQAAIRIADCLAAKTKEGNDSISPLPFRVNAITGESGKLFNNNMSGTVVQQAAYTTNWTGTMLLFNELETLNPKMKEQYSKAFNTLLEWMKAYPLKTNRWGPFFEDIPGWSDTQINAITFAMFILEHPQWFPQWKDDARSCIEWAQQTLGNEEYAKFKVKVMNEQTVYTVPGNSHTSRQSSIELLYAKLTGDTTWKANAIKGLHWGTYTVAGDGRNRYIRDDIWLTDGYGDYVRHYLRAMAACPELAPDNKNRLLGSSSVVTHIHYSPKQIDIKTFDSKTSLTLRTLTKPQQILVGTKNITEQKALNSEGWNWKPLEKGGILTITVESANTCTINFD